MPALISTLPAGTPRLLEIMGVNAKAIWVTGLFICALVWLAVYLASTGHLP